MESLRRSRVKSKVLGSDYLEHEKQKQKEDEARTQLEGSISSSSDGVSGVSNNTTIKGCGCLVVLFIILCVIYYLTK